MSGWMCRAPKLMTGSGAAASTHLAGGRGPAGRLGEHPEERRLVQAEPAVARPDPEDDLLGRDAVAVVERLELGLGRVGLGEDVAEQVLRLVDPAQDRVLAGEDLHRDERVEALPLEDALGAREVDVGRVAGQDLVRGSDALHAHQSGVLPSSRRSRPRSAGGTGPEVAASVAYGPRAAAPAAARPAGAGRDLMRCACIRLRRRRPVPRRGPSAMARTTASRMAASSIAMLTTRPCPIDVGAGPGGLRPRRRRAAEPTRSPAAKAVSRRGEVASGSAPHRPRAMTGSAPAGRAATASR